MVNLIFPVISDSVEYKKFFDKTKQRKDVNFLVGVTEALFKKYKVTATASKTKVIVFENNSKKEEMINALKDYAKKGELLIIRSPIEQSEIDEFVSSKADVTYCAKKKKGKIRTFFENLGDKIIKLLFGFTPYNGDVTAIKFGKSPGDILREGYNISYATRVDRWKGYSYASVDVEAKAVKLEYNVVSVIMMLITWITLFLGAIAGTVVYFVFNSATFLSVFIAICILFLLLTAVFISTAVALLKMRAGERYFGKAKEIKKERKNEKNKNRN